MRKSEFDKYLLFLRTRKKNTRRKKLTLTFKHFTSDRCPKAGAPTPYRRISSRAYAEPFLRHERRLRLVTHFGSKHDAEKTLAHHAEQSQVLGLDFPRVGRLALPVEGRQGDHRRTIVEQLHSILRQRRVESLLATNVGDGKNDDESDDENERADGDGDCKRKVRISSDLRNTNIF